MAKVRGLTRLVDDLRRSALAGSEIPVRQLDSLATYLTRDAGALYVPYPLGDLAQESRGRVPYPSRAGEPSLTFTKFSALEARLVRTQPRTVTSLPGATDPESACWTLTTAMP